MKITLLDAMEALGVGGYVKNNDFDSIVWANPSETVSKEILEAKVTELQADYDSKQYQRDRAVAYPSIQDQLDMLYHQGIDGWKAEINKVKDAHPKPE